MTVYVNAIMYYRVKDPIKAVSEVDDYEGSVRLLAATTLRNVLGTKNLGDLLAERESIAQAMQKLLHEAAGPWGVHVERVEGRDVRVPEPLMRAMAAEAEAAREASAKVIAAEGEYKASRALNHAADVIADCPAALEVGLTDSHTILPAPFQLRYLQTLNNISTENNRTIIIPIPLQIIAKFMKKKSCNKPQ